MFGKRFDGREVREGIDPITRVVPYVMVERVDTQCYCTQYADVEPIQAYLREKRAEGIKMSHMSVIIAAYVRMVSQMPELNRFVVGRKVYARNHLCVSFAMVKSQGKDDFLETTVKVYFDPSDTVLEVNRKIEETIERNREMVNSNKTDKVANTLLNIPGLTGFAVGLLMWMDKHGIMPHQVIEASPFHTSMFITNMASIGMNEVHHHLYNFGTTTVFLGLGGKESRLKVDRLGHISSKKVLPIAVTTDERICPGAFYGMAFKKLDYYLKNPKLLETPPETVKYEKGHEYHAEKISF